MNNIEEQIWNYIDGNCSADEQAAIGKLIAADEAYRLKYNELLQLNSEFALMEVDEPSMAFTYNVMEGIRTGQAQVPLKAAINKRLIFGIATFFIAVISILVIFAIFAISSIKISMIGTSAPQTFTMPDVTHYISKPVIEGFAFFDVVIALFFFDGYLRRKTAAS